MLKPSRETLVIRGLVERLSSKELRHSGPKDFQQAVEEAGLDYKQVRSKINNELTRLRRMRGIRKGQGRKAAPNPEELLDSEYKRLCKMGLELDGFKERWFRSWREAAEVAEGLFRFAERSGSAANLLLLMKTKGEDEKGAEPACDQN
jgi:hypothetical protein